MKKNTTTIMIVLLLALSFDGYGQDKTEGDVSPGISKITIINPGLSYERRIGKLQTLYFQGFISTSAVINIGGALGSSTKFYFDPALTLQYRYYFNYKKRDRKGLRTEMNSLNYISPEIETIFSSEPITSYFSSSFTTAYKRRPLNRVGVVWGMQRNYPKRFSLDLNIGLGYLFASTTYYDYTGLKQTLNQSSVSTLGQLNLGIWLNKRNTK